jgi:hypothetical protein
LRKLSQTHTHTHTHTHAHAYHELSINCIFTYFWIAIWLSYQRFIHACSEANFRKNCFSTNFSSVFSFQSEMSRQTYSWVRTLTSLSIYDLAVYRLDEYVPRLEASLLLYLPFTQYCIFVLIFVMLCVFLRISLEILAVFAHLFSFQLIDLPISYQLIGWLTC